MNQVCVYTSFDDLPTQYTALFKQAEDQYGAFVSLPWFHNFDMTVIQPNGHLRIYVVESAGPANQPLLALVMQRASHLTAKHTLTLQAATNYYSPLFAITNNSPTENMGECMDRLARFMTTERPRWDKIDLQPVDLADGTLNQFTLSLSAAGMWVQNDFCFGNWYLEINGRSAQEYLDGLPGKLKNTIKRKSAHLIQANRLQIDIVTDEHELESAIIAFETIYASSWKTPEPYKSFIPGLIKTCAQQGWLRLGIAYIDGKPAAAQLWIVSSGVASIYKLAYDASYSKLSIGSILTMKLMQHVIDIDRVKQVDFLSGDDSYKKDWMSHRRERSGIIAFNLRTGRGLKAAIRHMLGKVRRRLTGRQS